jgi:NADP-dependent 3-hydroxy acid dehydrogenase YdfG
MECGCHHAHPEKRKTLLHEKGLPDLVHLDVGDKGSILAAVKYAVKKYQRVDVLVNNAGYAMYGPFEAAIMSRSLHNTAQTFLV